MLACDFKPREHGYGIPVRCCVCLSLSNTAPGHRGLLNEGGSPALDASSGLRQRWRMTRAAPNSGQRMG